MELIVTSFLLIGLSLFGHVATVIADQLRRPSRRERVIADDPDRHPPPKRMPVYSDAAGAQAVQA